MGVEGMGWGELPPGDQDTKQCSQGAPAPQRTAQGKQKVIWATTCPVARAQFSAICQDNF